MSPSDQITQATGLDKNHELTLKPTIGDPQQSQGVTRMEAVYREAKSDRKTLWLIGVSVLVCAWAYSLDSSTTSYYSVDASSYFKQHSSVLSTLSIATSIISAVSKPFIAKISDITSRPYTYTLVLFFYVLGYIIVATCRTIAGYVVGEVFVAIGSSGLDLTNDIIVADLTPLEWRGFASSMLSTPFIINTWFAGKIVDAIDSKGQWRLGYGMFAIIMPVALGPAVATLIYLDRKAKENGIVNIASSNAARRAAGKLSEREGRDIPHGTVLARAAGPSEPWMQSARRILDEIDALGLVFLGFGWSLLLLPFSLKTYADGGWRNQSLIAMMIVGGLLLIAYVIYEVKWAPVPSAPRRLVFNKTFTMAIIIDSFYMLAGSVRGLYWDSYVYIAKPWSYQNWVYYGNTLTLALCIAGPFVGLLQRWTHRYKAIQIAGLVIKIIGMGIMLDGSMATANTGAMVMAMILVGFGGSMSVVGSRVASQASVPHQDVALAISLLSLWSKIGRAIGSAIVAVIWADQMPKQLRKYLPSNATEADVKKLFGSPTSIRKLYGFDDPMRVGAVLAYRHALYYCLATALGLAFIPLIASLFQHNYFLGKSQNAVTNVGNDGLPLAETRRSELEPPKNKKEAFLRFWAGALQITKTLLFNMPAKLIDRYDHVPVTKENLDWAELVTLDLSQYDQPGGKEDLVKQLDHAVRHVGFFYVKNFNISQDEIDRQFALGREFYALPLEEKLKYHSASDLEKGEYNGYRPAGHRALGNGVKDNVQVYNIPKFDGYHQRQQPPILGDHLEEIEAFSRKCHTEVVEKLLRLFAILLELPDEEQLVKDHQYDVKGEDHLRYMHYAARGAEENKIVGVTLLFRQPVAALQILNSQGQWKWVRPQDGTITVNTCDALTALTGGLIKSSIHRVHVPPADQAHVDRLGVLYFARPNNHVVLDPIQNSPLLNRLGLTQNVFTELGQHLTTEQWVKVRQTQQQRRTRDAKISEDGKYTYRPKDLEIIPGLHAKVYN
ncbi:hypothetical protein BDV30DRAFT_225628 [Aspergillus minisclerotigenes]|uniref:Non-haem dioxygenase N-terminal domain-containing protein n=1 Tax=Aspergillus minisclerotigenes TaxID=656917 RepID=A0A5N6J8W1_9EURO|nr:hypothetical protein BDV30DRAFT_225628 [Aspergillus minisclerotigenes]